MTRAKSAREFAEMERARWAADAKVNASRLEWFLNDTRLDPSERDDKIEHLKRMSFLVDFPIEFTIEDRPGGRIILSEDDEMTFRLRHL